jgi:NADH-ubiquinone oxidoreductase chain 5
MDGTVDFLRFVYLVALFVCSMALLVFGSRMLLVMVGWDGLGLVSFCLVIFYANSRRVESGLITVYSNRLGDAFFILRFFYFFSVGFLSFDVGRFGVGVFFSLLLVCGAITKRAQVPFSAWLPAAMAAPTPVSSLVHSSTLVTAGVYLLIRFNFLFRSFLSYVGCFALITMALAGFCACVEKDLKKVVAMSTLSQLGLIMYCLRVGLWKVSFLHMVIHAIFKSMLFLSCGSFIIQGSGLQDSRFFGSHRVNRWSLVFGLLRVFSLVGFPFAAGFYSKDFLLSFFLTGGGFVMFALFFVSCVLTVVYRVRFLNLGYFIYRSGSTSVGFVEGLPFFLPVSVIGCWCVFVGTFYFWALGGDFFLFSGGFRYLFGLFVISVGLVFFGFFSLFFASLARFFSLIGFLVWISGGGISRVLYSFFRFVKFDLGWSEVLGGQGIVGAFFVSSYSLHWFSRIGLVGTLTMMLFLFFLLSLSSVQNVALKVLSYVGHCQSVSLLS